ncbi:MAG: TonB-dependent receptor [Rikenellaceae bacterium]
MNAFFRGGHTFVMLLLCLATVATASAQQRVTGKIVDGTGEPLAGVAVIDQQTNKGVASDIDGNYAIDGVTSTSVLVFSYIGMESQEYTVGGRTVLNVTMASDDTVLDEVVVVGYGSIKKESLTGSVATVSAAKFEDQGGLSSPLQAIQGQVPGVMITRTSSAPGEEGWEMVLRGRSSSNTADPMVVVDGITYNSITDLNMLNSDDIESMNFLKDGSAAIYGSRAANGVILITTKKGKVGKVEVQYNASMTVKTPGIEMDWCTAEEWGEGMMTALENANNTSHQMYQLAAQMSKYAGYYVDYQTQARTLSSGFASKLDMPFDATSDLSSDLWQTAISQEHTLSVSGGTEASSYRVSLGYNYDDSNLKWGNNNNQRYNIRVNNTMKLSKAITLNSVIGYNRTERVEPTAQSSLSPGNFSQPGLPSWTPSGLPYAYENLESIPAALELSGDTEYSKKILNINESFKVDFNEHLNLNVDLGYTQLTQNEFIKYQSVDYYNYTETTVVMTLPEAANTYTQATVDNKDYYTSAGYLNYSNQYGDHLVAATLGGSYEYTTSNDYGIKMTNIDPTLDVVNGTGEVTRTGVNSWETSLASVFARFNYDYDSRYLLEANMRYDGSSKFAKGNRWNFFWGVSGGWRINQEEFLEDVNWLTDLKLRGSYAIMGNQDGIGNYDGVQLYTLTTGEGAYIGEEYLSYISAQDLASDSRTWERIENWNVGLDFSLFGFSGSFDYWRKYNGNMLISVTYPNTLGTGTPDTNVGKFEAWGYEGSLQYRGQTGDFTYFAGGTFSFARNKILDNGTDVSVFSSGYSSTREGYPLSGLFGLEATGRALSDEEAQAYYAQYNDGCTFSMPASQWWTTGMLMYKDQNNDGVLDEEDLIYLGTDNPEISYSLNAGFGWKGLEVSAVFQGAANRVMYYGEGYVTTPMRSKFHNSTSAYIGNTWSLDNQDGWFSPLITGDASGVNTWNYGIPSTHTAVSGDYIRLKNITVAYTLPKYLLANSKFITGIRVYATGTDLWEKDSIPFDVDPEASRSSFSGSNYYTFTRNMIVGVNLTF